MLKQALAVTLMMFYASSALAAVQCGPFTIKSEPHGGFYVNNAKAERVKTTFTGKSGDTDNVRYHWIVKNTRAPGKLAMEQTYVHGKATLNVEIVRTSSQQVRLSGDYDCVKAGEGSE